MPDVLQLYPVCLRGSYDSGFPARREEDLQGSLSQPTGRQHLCLCVDVLVCDRCRETADSSLKKEAGETAQGLRALTVLQRTWGLIPDIHMMAHSHL